MEIKITDVKKAIIASYHQAVAGMSEARMRKEEVLGILVKDNFIDIESGMIYPIYYRNQSVFQKHFGIRTPYACFLESYFPTTEEEKQFVLQKATAYYEQYRRAKLEKIIPFQKRIKRKDK